MRYTAVLIFIAWSLLSFGQKEKKMMQVQKGPDVFELINAANDKVNTDTETATNLIQRALKQSIKEGNLRAEGYCYNTLGAINYKLNVYSVSANNYLKSIRIFEKVDDQKGRYNSLKYIGQAYEADNDSKAAMEYYLIFLKLAEKEGNLSDQKSTLQSLGRVMYNQGLYKKSEVYFQDALSLAKKMNDKNDIARIQNWLGLVEERQGNNEEAVQLYNQSSQIGIDNKDVEVVNQSYENLGNYYRANDDQEQYLDIQQKAYDYNQQVNNKRGELNASKNIAEANLEIDNPVDAIPYIKNTIDLSMELGDIAELSEARKLLSEAYEKQGNFDSALEEYEAYLELVDSVTNIRAKEELLALRMSRDLNSKVAEINRLRSALDEEKENAADLKANMRRKEAEAAAQREKDRIIMLSLAGILLIAIVSSWLIYRSSREKRIANQLLALKSLRSQMNPHFIFNSLNSVNNFIAKNDERSANKYLSEFSRLMRAVMENSKHDFVSLTSELDILRLYLDLEHLRFSDKFDYTFVVDPALDADHVMIPPMLIQPYIENSIWHGLRYKEEKGNLKVEFKDIGGKIHVTIEDDGIGRKRSQELKTRNQLESKSTGMKNIEGRLNILNELHNTSLGVHVVDLEVEGEAVGTRVEITIPYNTNKEAA